MINVYEAKSYRVKGISFHPSNSWVLTTLHNGVILIYDYRHGILLDKYEEHEGPVRSGHFHNTQPFFVSGGDDCKIKLWNYNTKRCIFNLLGHTDYIRTVQFHSELPWIISASDDQTIRIWNWLNRTLLTTVTGHDHYVMSAFFHPTQDLIVSSSLDQTIRVWDYSTLRKKFFEARTNAYEVLTMDVTVKFKLDGHDRGVNWAVFHPTLMLIASGADDKNIKIWKYSDVKCTEADTLRGHFNNVSSVVFHPTLDILISNSEDKSLRIWDLAKKTCIEKVTKDTDRFWIVSSHPTLNIFACGSDSGILVFKLESTRIPSVSIPGNRIIFYQNKEIRLWKIDETDKQLLFTSKFNSKTLRHGVKRIVYNHFITSPNTFIFALVCNDSMSRSIYYYNLKMENNKVTGEEQCLDGQSIVFISKEKGLLLRNSTLIIFDCSNPSKASSVLEIPGITKDIIEEIFQAPLGKFIIKLKNEVIGLVDTNSKKIISELNDISDLKNVIWNNNMSLASFVGKNSIYLINKNFEILNSMRENSNIKSCSFDENGILFYSTHFHIKYFLSEKGLSGIIKSIKTTSYLMMVLGSRMYYSDSLQQLKVDKFLYTDCKLNLALQNKNYDDIVNILKTTNIFGKKLVENIQNAGFPDLSLNFVCDKKQKFQLALESEKLEEAKEAADLLNNKEYYYKLAEKAMFIGKTNIAEYCYLKSNDFDKLLFFYMLTGKRDKLQKLEAIFQSKCDNSRRFLNTIYTGNTTDRIKLLAETGKIPLALLTAKIQKNEELEKFLVQNSTEVLDKLDLDQFDQIIKDASPLAPLKPILSRESKDYNSCWVSLHEYKKSKQTVDSSSIFNEIEKENENISQNIEGNLNMLGNDEVKEVKEEKKKEVVKKNIGKNWKSDEEEEEDPEIKAVMEPAQKKNIDIQVLTTPDHDLVIEVNKNSLVPGIHIALGNFQKAINLLKTQIKLANIEAILPQMKNIYLSNHSQFKFIPCLQNNFSHIRNSRNGKMLPTSCVSITNILSKLNKAYDLGITDEALSLFREILAMTLFFIAYDKNEENVIKEIINICTEYCYLIRMNQFKEKVKSVCNKLKKDKIKNAEISCMMTICKLEQPIHYYFIYNKAKIACKNIKNYLTAVHFCKNILALEKDIAGSEEVDFDKIKSEFVNYQNLGTNAHQLPFNITENIKFARSNIDAINFNLIREKNSIKCPMCSSSYLNNAVNSVCENCKLSILGHEYLGLKLTSEFN